MTFYAVIDTNVLVSSLLRSESFPGEVVRLALEGPIIPLVNHEIVDEYRDVLTRNKFGFAPDRIEKLIEDFSKRALFLDRTPVHEIFPDPDDAVFYEVVMTGRQLAEAYLVTGNGKHFPAKPFVVTPREMLKIVEANIDKR